MQTGEKDKRQGPSRAGAAGWGERVGVRVAWLVMVVGTVVGSACSQSNPAYTPDAPNVGPMCTTNANCSGEFGVCDVTGSKQCVECLPAQAAACTATSPVCDSTTKACRGCSAHSDCASEVCLPDGSCASDVSVAYVAAGGTGNCEKGRPCGTLAEAALKSATYVKVTGKLQPAAKTTLNRRIIIVGAPGAELTRTGEGPVLEVNGPAADATLIGVKVSGATGTSGHGITMTTDSGTPKLTVTGSTVSGNSGVGINASGGQLTVTGSTVSGNTGGGVAVSNSSFNITNNFIVKNGFPQGGGAAVGTTGGVLIRDIGAGAGQPRQFQFNTVSGNGVATASESANGVRCTDVLAPVAFANNIVWGNTGGASQVTSSVNCSWTYSLVEGVVTGTGNVNSDPKFVSSTDYHLQSSSPAKDAADPAATMTTDFDGDTRPVNGRRDIGADEVK